jgi:hypothetical protein
MGSERNVKTVLSNRKFHPENFRVSDTSSVRTSRAVRTVRNLFPARNFFLCDDVLEIRFRALEPASLKFAELVEAFLRFPRSSIGAEIVPET